MGTFMSYLPLSSEPSAIVAAPGPPWCREQTRQPLTLGERPRQKGQQGTATALERQLDQGRNRNPVASARARSRRNLRAVWNIRSAPRARASARRESALPQGWLETNAAREKVVLVQTRNVLGPLAWRYLNRTQEFTLTRELTVKCELGLGR